MMGTGGDACAYDGYVVFNVNGGLLYHNPKSLYRQFHFSDSNSYDPSICEACKKPVMRPRNNPAIDVDTVTTSAGTLQTRLVLGCDLLTRELLNSLLCPIVCISTGLKPIEKKTYISPSATIHIVCQTPNPIRGVTPRYNPLIPLFE